MKTYTPEELKEILRLHAMWLCREAGGVRADLSHTNLIGADLRDANLRDANLRDAILTGANLSDANLASCRGVQYVQFSFQGLGAESRQWSAVKVDGAWRAFCGCWSGSLDELKDRIEQKGGEELESRRDGLKVLVRMCKSSDKAAI